MLNRKSPVLRIIALLVLLVDFPFLSGLDQLVYSLQAQEQGGPEKAAYELFADEQVSDLARQQEFSVLKVYEWCRVNIKYEPYFGSLKGGSATYADRCGNDLDQAMLLGSLLELCKAEWRLAVGDVRLPVEEAKSWLGAGSAEQVARLLQEGGVPHELLPDSNSAKELLLKNHH